MRSLSTRLNFACACAFAFAPGSVPAATRAPGPSARPNILWLTAEDISPNLGCYGDRYASTPALDRLAARGVRFTRAYGITGVCAPNRSCLVTGVYPSSLGSHGMRSATVLPASIRCFPEYLRAAGYRCTNNAKTDYNFPVPTAAWDACSPTAHYRNRAPGQPFFAVFNHEVCHESQIRAPEPRRRRNTARLAPHQRHDPAQAPIPPFHPDIAEARLDWARYHDNISAMDIQIADKLDELERAGLAESTIVFFFGDNGAGMPGVKKWIWQDGLHVPLIIRFPERYRHLAPASPGGATDRLVSFVDFAPTLLALAGVPIPAHMQGVPFLGAHSGEPRRCVYAIRDRMAERFDTVRAVHDGRHLYLRNFQPHLPWSQYVSYTEEMPTMRAWRTLAETRALAGPPARYFARVKPVEELYDTQADPHTVRNLAGDPAHAALLEKMRARCSDWMRATHDLGLLPEHEMERRAEGQTPWEMGRDPASNPVARLLAAAELAGAMDPARIFSLLDLLRERDPALRWWGATGLGALGPGAGAAAGAALVGRLDDSSAEVRVAAADALCRIGPVDRAMPTLIAALKHPHPLIRLRALNTLDRLGAAARVVLPEIRAAATGARDHISGYVNRMVDYVPRRIGP